MQTPTSWAEMRPEAMEPSRRLAEVLTGTSREPEAVVVAGTTPDAEAMEAREATEQAVAVVAAEPRPAEETADQEERD